jgi:hypothetical protein
LLIVVFTSVWPGICGSLAGSGAICGYRLGGLERIGAELASDMGVPPSVKTKEDYHKNFEDVNFGDLLRSLLDRHPGEPLIMSGVGTGVKNILN